MPGQEERSCGYSGGQKCRRQWIYLIHSCFSEIAHSLRLRKFRPIGHYR